MQALVSSLCSCSISASYCRASLYAYSLHALLEVSSIYSTTLWLANAV